MKHRIAKYSLFAGTIAVLVAAVMFGSHAVSGACEVDGPCVRACERAFDACTDRCVLPDGRIDITCVSRCAAELSACVNGCTTCP